MRKVRAIVISLAAIVTMAAAAVPVSTSYADDTKIDCSGGAAACIGQGQKNVGGDKNTTSLEDQIKTITNVLLFLIGAIAVIMVIIGGIRYATSNGDASQTKAAKDTILYAVIGVIVAILAYAIVNFAITAFTKT